MTLGEAEKKFVEELRPLYEEQEVKALATLALSHVCESSRGQIWMNRQERLSATQATSLLLILEELKTGKPLQYILGETEFYGMRFFVNSSVLIPRPETEELVHWILDEMKLGGSKHKSLLDIGTGSGCIPIVIKKNLPEMVVSGIDVSFEALETAMKNAVLNKTEVSFRRVDILREAALESTSQKYSIIVSNPPYITVSEREQMHQNVVSHEPHPALFVSDDDPLLFYRAIADFSLTHLEPEGLLFFEINEHLGKETVSMLHDKGFKDIQLRQDLQGKDRMIKASSFTTWGDIV